MILRLVANSLETKNIDNTICYKNRQPPHKFKNIILNKRSFLIVSLGWGQVTSLLTNIIGGWGAKGPLAPGLPIYQVPLLIRD